jgi:RNA recognition motif-containing protein
LAAKIYVGNLSFQSSEDDLRELFEKHGTVESVAIITDRDTGRSRGFAFVEMGSASEAQAAIRALDGTTMDGRPLRVNEAQEKSRGGGGGGGGGRDGGGRGGPRGGGGGRSW